MFASRQTRLSPSTPSQSPLVLDVAFTDRWGGTTTGPYASLDLTRERAGDSGALAANWAALATAFDVPGFVSMRQVHGAEVVTVRRADATPPPCDALVTDVPGVALCVRVGDCVPLVLADVSAAVIAVAHVGRPGVAAGTVAATVAVMTGLGARSLEAWVGPHVCGGCYEVPAALREAVAAVEPQAFACTTWGTPCVDIGAAVVAQLGRAGCTSINRVDVCTRESEDFFSYRRQGPSSGRQAGLVVLRAAGPDQQARL